jgi:hypothetical protein
MVRMSSPWAEPAVGHGRGLHRGVPHGFRQRRVVRHPLSQKTQHGGLALPYHNRIMIGEHSGRSTCGEDSTAAGGAMARHRPPFRAMMCSSGGRGMSIRPCSATLCREGGSAMTEQASQRASGWPWPRRVSHRGTSPHSGWRGS